MKFLIIALISMSAFAEGNPQDASFASFIPLILLMVVFYFLLIRPQSKKAKEHKELLNELKKNDEVVTNGGTLGKVIKVEDSFVQVEISENVVIKVQKQAITQKLPKGTI
ncbi:Preprotein translocase subunit YajC (TC 3.A.5.1.1) [hydrothermal vent metagenome]|uniref:Preprotein translocase subunit YajC (TC 3.A.5.1.1) n=1 Tax=hydrothermal vent metagenome TaxID=652676 RepID=A0A1W1CT56_9ZZZZ